MYLNPNIFFIIKDAQLIVWDYQNHQQFVIEPKYLERLLLWAKTIPETLSPLDEELENGLLLVREKPEETAWGWDLLSHIYHMGTSNIPDKILTPEEWIESYVSYCQEIAENPPTLKPQNGQVLSLMDPDITLLETTNLIDVYYKRKTSRSFHGKSITLTQLSTLLYFSFGIIHKEWPDMNGLKQYGVRKAFPAGGGLHAEETYIVILRVDGLEPGIYHYDDADHSLRFIEHGFFEQDIIDLLSSQYYAKGLAVGIFLTSQFDKYWWKYPHSRGYRPALLDIGHASQTCLLTATGLGLNTWLTAAFHDEGIRKLLDLKETSESPLLFIGIGHGDNDTLDPKIREVLELKQK